MKLKTNKIINKDNPVRAVLYLLLLLATIPVYLAANPLYEYVSSRYFGRDADVVVASDTEGGTVSETGASGETQNPQEETETGSEETETVVEKEPVYVKVYRPGYADDHYFDDAMFIGDSRTIGLYDYSGIQADYYCSKGYCTYQWKKGKKTILQNTGEKVDLGQVLLDNHYGKVYLMIGLNDGGFGSVEDYRSRVSAMIECIMQTQPDAVVFLMANLKTTASWSSAHPDMNNDFLEGINQVLSEIADTDDRLFYLDVNPFYCDEEGNMRSGLSSDGVHLHASQYGVWTEFIKAAAVYTEEVPEDEAEAGPQESVPAAETVPQENAPQDETEPVENALQGETVSPDNAGQTGTLSPGNTQQAGTDLREGTVDNEAE